MAVARCQLGLLYPSTCNFDQHLQVTPIRQTIEIKGLFLSKYFTASPSGCPSSIQTLTLKPFLYVNPITGLLEPMLCFYCFHIRMIKKRRCEKDSLKNPPLQSWVGSNSSSYMQCRELTTLS